MSKFGKDELGTRMKEYYEAVPKTSLVRKVPVAIRLDGSHFHTFTRGFDKPFDEVLIKSMQEAMKYCCEHIQGCVLGYTQSDEITLILTDYKKQNSSAWFDYEVMKICSTSAAMATMAFNKAFEKNVKEFEVNNTRVLGYVDDEKKEKVISLIDTYYKAMETGATFDSRCFNIPKEEIANLVYWRQQDAAKNSVSMAAYANFPHGELKDKSTSDRMDMLMLEKGINWNDYPTTCKRGSCCIKSEDGWVIDNEIPIFKGEGRSYVEDRVNFTGVGADIEKPVPINKMHILKERLSVIEENVEEALFNIRRTGKDTFTITWQPQYGAPYDMYANLSDDGVLIYGADENDLENSDWFNVAESVDETWTKEKSLYVKTGQVKPRYMLDELTLDEEESKDYEEK